MNLLDFKDYREYIKSYISSLPKAGRGYAAKLAAAIEVSPVLISQVLSGSRSFSLEQALKLSKQFSLNPVEQDYFMELVHLDRAGTLDLQAYHEAKLSQLGSKLMEVKSRLKDKKELNQHAKAVYYSNWYMVAIRLIINNPHYQSLESISEALAIPLLKVKEAIDFLLEYDLISESDGVYEWKGTSTHIPADSALVGRHHQNWRLRGMQHLENYKQQQNEIFFTSPMIIDKKAAEELKKRILSFIAEAQAVSGPAPSEDLYCLNLDFFPLLGTSL